MRPPRIEVDGIEEHLFSCDDCSARLAAMSSLGAGLSALVRRGHVAGVVSRSLLNRIQRDGVQVRLYSLSPGERVPCAAFPGDDLMVLALRADLSGSESVTLSLTDDDDAVVGQAADIPVGRGDGEILWATPGDAVRRMPSSRLRLRLSSSAPDTDGACRVRARAHVDRLIGWREFAGPLVRWSAGPLVRWSAGPLVRWSLVRWVAGPPVRWVRCIRAA